MDVEQLNWNERGPQRTSNCHNKIVTVRSSVRFLNMGL